MTIEDLEEETAIRPGLLASFEATGAQSVRAAIAIAMADENFIEF